MSEKSYRFEAKEGKVIDRINGEGYAFPTMHDAWRAARRLEAGELLVTSFIPEGRAGR